MKFKLLAAALLACTAQIASAQSDVVRLGVPNDRSGIYADLGGLGSEISVRMAVEDFGGSVLGKKIEVLGGDNQNKVDVGSTMVRRWFDTENMVAFIDGGASSVGLAEVNVAKEKGGTAVITGGFAGDFVGKQCTNISTQWAPDTYALSNAVVRSTVEQGGKTWYFMQMVLELNPDYTNPISGGYSASVMPCSVISSAVLAEAGAVVNGPMAAKRAMAALARALRVSFMGMRSCLGMGAGRER